MNGKVIVVTGSCGLLGQIHTEAIAAFGGVPILIDLSKEKVEKEALKLKAKHGVDAQGFCVDITNEKQVKENAKIIYDKYGSIDGLINNAANNPKVEDNNKDDFSRLEKFPIDIWNADLAVGLTGAFLSSKHYGPYIARNKTGGVIINISSDLGLIAPDQRLYKKENTPDNQQPVKPVSYSVIKTGIIGLTRYLSTYWIERGVRCNALCPGGVEDGQPKEFYLKFRQEYL